MKKEIKFMIFSIFVFILIFSASVHANVWENDNLLGNWNGSRGLLEEKGLSYELIYTGEYVRNFKGGIAEDKTSYMDNIDLTMTLDTEKLGWWKGGTFFAYGLSNHSTHLATEEYIGDLQTVSNIEAPEKTRLYEIWYEQEFYDGILSVLFGQHDLNSEFSASEYGGLFLNSSFGIAPDISANIPVSIFPLAAPAIRFKYTPNERHEVLFGIYDGDPGDTRENQKWDLNSEQGYLYIIEEDYHRESDKDGTYKCGFWYHTSDFADISNPMESHNGNYGGYAIIDQVISKNGTREWAVFTQLGAAPKDRNIIEFYVGGGVHCQGFFNNRPDDVFGLAIADANISEELRSIENMESSETVVELTYQMQVNPWFVLKPSIQKVYNPSADPSLDDAVVGFLRFEVIL